MRQVFYERKAAKAMARAPSDVRRRFHEAFARLLRGSDRGPTPGVVKLSGRDAWRLRVGRWRAIFRYDAAGNIVVLHVAPRGSICR